MDEVFDVEGAGSGDYDEDDNDHEDDIKYFQASDRYQLTQEDTTQSNMMKIQSNANNLDMIENV